MKNIVISPETLKERIDMFMTRYPDPVQYKLRLDRPKKDGTHIDDWWHLDDGLEFSTPDETHPAYRRYYSSQQFVRKRNYSTFYMLSVRSDLELGLLEIAIITHDTKSKKDENDNRKWYYCQRHFIDRGTREIYDINGHTYTQACPRGRYDAQRLWRCYRGRDYWSAYNEKSFLSSLFNNNEFSPMNFWQEIIEKDFFKDDARRGPKVTDVGITHPWHINEWLLYVPKQRTKGKVQKTIDELIKQPLPDIAIYEQAIKDWIAAPDQHHYYYNMVAGVAFVVPEYKCIRCLAVTLEHAGTYKDEKGYKHDLYRMSGVHEEKRVYILDRKPVVAFLNSNGEWVPLGSCTAAGLDYKFLDDNDILKLPNMEWVKELIHLLETKTSGYYSSSGSQSTVYRVCRTLKSQELETLVKLKFPRLAQKLGADPTESCLKALFGEPVKKSSRSMFTKWGFTQKQLRVVEESIAEADAWEEEQKAKATREGKTYYGYRPFKPAQIADTKTMFRMPSIASLDDETFKKYCGFFTQYRFEHSDTGELLGTARYDSWTGSYEIAYRGLRRAVDLVGNGSKVATRLFVDIMRTWSRLSGDFRPAFDPMDFRTERDMQRIHDALVALQIQQDAERCRVQSLKEAERAAYEEERRKKIDKQRVKWGFEDENFVIKLPNSLAEITNEGIALHHCVGGYTHTHAVGETTIMFLRRKEAINESFYTIEVRDSRVVQIHGACNKWLGNNPEAIPTVVKWLRQNNFDCSDMILRSTAKGYYSGNAPLCPMPVV